MLAVLTGVTEYDQHTQQSAQQANQSICQCSMTAADDSNRPGHQTI